MARQTIDQHVEPVPPVPTDRDTLVQREDVDLSVICLLVSQRGGHIHVNNTSPSGTTLTIFLPPVDASLRSCEPTEFSLPATQQTQRILVVDDDEALRRFAATVLDSAGYSVQEAESGEDAMKIIENGAVDLILADVVMPRMSGRQLASLISENSPNTKVLLMSGFPKVSGLLSGIASRAEKPNAECEFLPKPFTPSDLLARVRKLLDAAVTG